MMNILLISSLFIIFYLVPIMLIVNFNFKRRDTLKKTRSKYSPNVTIILPFKGLDYGLEQTISALAQQEYDGNYEVLFVTSEKVSEARTIIEKNIQNKDNMRMITAGETALHRSDKVNNLLSGIQQMSKESKVFAVIDSDIVPHKCWLQRLVAPLQLKDCGLSSGSGWISARDEDWLCYATRFWDFLASILMAFSPTSFARGFSMAMHKKVFDKIKMDKIWSKAFHDNLTLTDVVKNNRYKIYYSPQCLVSHCFNWKGIAWLEWVKRQSLNTRVNYNKLWRYGFFLLSLPRLVAFLGCAVSYAFLLFGKPFQLLMLPFVLWPFLHFIIAFFLINAIFPDRNLYPNFNGSLKSKLKLTIASYGTVLLSLSSIAAILTKRIFWRGSVYQQNSPFTTTIIKDEE